MKPSVIALILSLFLSGCNGDAKPATNKDAATDAQAQATAIR